MKTTRVPWWVTVTLAPLVGVAVGVVTALHERADLQQCLIPGRPCGGGLPCPFPPCPHEPIRWATVVLGALVAASVVTLALTMGPALARGSKAKGTSASKGSI